MSENRSDLELIAQTVQYYFDGMYNSDTEMLKKAFHTDAVLFGYYQGNLSIIPLEDWLGMIKQTPAPAESGEEYDMRIVSIDLVETVATVKVADVYIGLRFTDYLSLLKIEDNWVVVNKTFYHEPQ